MSYKPSTLDFSATDYLTIEIGSLDSAEVAGIHEFEGTNYGDPKGLFLVVYEDGGSGRRFFQKKGKVNVKSYTPSNHKITAEFIDVILEEVEISGHSSSMVHYGSCLKVNNKTVSY